MKYRNMGMKYWLEKAEAEMRELGRLCGVAGLARLRHSARWHSRAH
jgi:hypothetical protein